MSVDLIHTDFGLLAIVEDDVGHQLVALAPLHSVYSGDKRFPVLFVRDPGSDLVVGIDGGMCRSLTSLTFRSWRFFRQGSSLQRLLRLILLQIIFWSAANLLMVCRQEISRMTKRRWLEQER